MCTLPFLERIMTLGIDSFKIEGRNKGPEYVRDVTSVYREAVDFIWDNREHLEDEGFKKELSALKERLMPKLERVFNRGFSGGFYLGKPLAEWSAAAGSVATEKKTQVGRVVKYYDKIGVAEIVIQGDVSLAIGDEIFIQGPRTGSERITIESMEIEHEPVEQATQGQSVAIKLSVPVRTNDDVSRVDAR